MLKKSQGTTSYSITPYFYSLRRLKNFPWFDLVVLETWLHNCFISLQRLCDLWLAFVLIGLYQISIFEVRSWSSNCFNWSFGSVWLVCKPFCFWKCRCLFKRCDTLKLLICRNSFLIFYNRWRVSVVVIFFVSFLILWFELALEIYTQNQFVMCYH